MWPTALAEHSLVLQQCIHMRDRFLHLDNRIVIRRRVHSLVAEEEPKHLLLLRMRSDKNVRDGIHKGSIRTCDYKINDRRFYTE
jgi:hypothetical protein